MTNAPEAEWHVVCEQCGQVMTPNSGCLPYIVFESGKRYKREPHFDDDDRPCHDCNAGPGKYHHTGCDSDVGLNRSSQQLLSSSSRTVHIKSVCSSSSRRSKNDPERVAPSLEERVCLLAVAAVADQLEVRASRTQGGSR